MVDFLLYVSCRQSSQVIVDDGFFVDERELPPTLLMLCAGCVLDHISFSLLSG